MNSVNHGTHGAHARWTIIAAGVLSLVACGAPAPLGTVPDTGAALDACGTMDAGNPQTRRLSQDEYARTVAALTGVPTDAAAVLDDPENHGFADTTTTAVGVLGADRYLRSAEAVTGRIGSDLPVCGPNADCLDAFLDGFGTLAFRRPLESEERAVFVELHAAVLDVDTAEAARDAVVQAILQSPQFLYRLEGHGTAEGLDGYARATRLAYFLWGVGPDAGLLERARMGGLDTPADVGDAVSEMLEDPRARQGIADFVEQWMGTADVEELQRDATRHPEWNETLATALREETRAFAEHVVFDGEGTLSELLTAPYTVTGPAGAVVHGVSVEEWGVVPLDPSQRAGLLTQPAVLATRAHDNQTSVTLRGLMVRERLLCQTLPLPPDDFDITLPSLDGELSTRERFARHSQDPACSGCHRLMDPVGLGFEHFDPIGAWRDTEASGARVDATGQLVGGPDSMLEGDFHGVPELAHRLADSPEVSACFTRNAARFAWGREPAPEDDCALARAGRALTTSEGDIHTLLAAIATDPAFMGFPETRP